MPRQPTGHSQYFQAISDLSSWSDPHCRQCGPTEGQMTSGRTNFNLGYLGSGIFNTRTVPSSYITLVQHGHVRRFAIGGINSSAHKNACLNSQPSSALTRHLTGTFLSTWTLATAGAPQRVGQPLISYCSLAKRQKWERHFFLERAKGMT